MGLRVHPPVSIQTGLPAEESRPAEAHFMAFRAPIAFAAGFGAALGATLGGILKAEAGGGQSKICSPTAAAI